MDANFDGPINTFVYAPEGLQVRFVETGLASVSPAPAHCPASTRLSLVAQSSADPEVIGSTADVHAHRCRDALPDIGRLNRTSVCLWATPFRGRHERDQRWRTGVPGFRFRAEHRQLQQPGEDPLPQRGRRTGRLAGAQRVRTECHHRHAGSQPQRTKVGLYVVPTSLPTPGTSFTIDVQLSDGLGGFAAASIPWTMPGQAHNFIEITPEEIYLGSTSSTDFAVTITNVGNAAGSFDLTATLPPVTATVTGLPAGIPSPSTKSDEYRRSLTTTGVPVGTRFPLRRARSCAEQLYTVRTGKRPNRQLTSPKCLPGFAQHTKRLYIRRTRSFGRAPRPGARDGDLEATCERATARCTSATRL